MTDEWPKSIDSPDLIRKLADNIGGSIQECALLPDGSGFAVMSMPLPNNHWLTAEGENEPPMPFRVGTGDETIHGLTRQQFADTIRAAAKYAIRASTWNGKEMDFDPDAMVQNFVVGMLGYWTVDGFSHVND